MFVGRKKEKEMLCSLKNEEESQFIAVFGRRRIGKTFLIRESFDYEFTFQHTGISNESASARINKQLQLDKFAESLKEYGYEHEGRIKSWNEAFNCLKILIDRSRKKKKIIFIDELSWMDTKGGGLISALENFWNGWAMARKQKDIVLIVCASATYWMMDNIVNSAGGLHNRLTGQIHLQAFTLKECEEYLKAKKIVFTRNQIMECYMIMGGVPYYWSLLKKGKSLPQNIDELFFKESAPLKNEYDNLYRALFNKPDQYLSIIDAMSNSNKGVSIDEISKRTGIARSGDLTRKMADLENCGFIRKYNAYGYKRNHCLYQLMDNYTLFYHKFLKDGSRDEDFWNNISGTVTAAVWRGLSFERLCLQHVTQMKAALGISGVHTEVNSWGCKAEPELGIEGSQIDLLIVRDDRIINLCEMKYSESEIAPNISFDRDRRRKINDFKIKTKTKHAVHYTLVTPYGLVENPYSGNIQFVITVEDLFR